MDSIVDMTEEPSVRAGSAMFLSRKVPISLPNILKAGMASIGDVDYTGMST